MKLERIITMLLVALVSATALIAQDGIYFSQSDSLRTLTTKEKHLKFMGMPINGSPRQFAQKLIGKGFKEIRLGSEEIITLLGTFAGVTDSKIFLYPSPASGKLYKVRVCFPDQSTWSQIEIRYKNFKGYLRKKYIIEEEIEKFHGDTPKTDFDRLWELIHDRCTYQTYFNSSDEENDYLGTIWLAVFKSTREGYGYIHIDYIDYLNEKDAQRGIIDDL